MSLTKQIRIVFMGTPDFAVPSLKVLMEQEWNVVGVVTQPDRPKGRKKILTPTPVKAEALNHDIPVYQPHRMKDPEAIEQLKQLQPDLIVTAAFGQILPKAVLDVPRFGCINVHASLLPKYRGGAPIHHAIKNGESVTGVTIMYMAEGLDTGDMISHVEVPILDQDNTGTMFEKLSRSGAELLKTTLPKLVEEGIQAEPQNHEEASYAPNIQREDELIDWQKSSKKIFNHIRALNPWPGSYTSWDGKVLKIWKSINPDVRTLHSENVNDAVPGTVIQMNKEGIEVKTGDGTIWLTEIQPAGKKRMDVAEFNKGSNIPEGTRFGS
ncbi:methionyl-tRNA formyltransferase [Chengkuizengella axinellae]|uniref:Methionyl-tRNA formyltransferase n=1 Tax=Chengkuizengella axinellae TaxID=3064388 RepID=A0ABT9IVI8_9BACL|nr:methionyl-tRNA formyltransferase [Chengkuizengella sp. 2205SS18-9]MDP5273365.1 methionyl-tRNA formyltransferase [Chengkuizengella sp. 2205SS18-9]